MQRNLEHSLKKIIKSNDFLKNFFSKLIKNFILKRLLFLFKSYKFKKKFKEVNLNILLKKEIKSPNHTKVIINKKDSLKTIHINFSKKILDEIVALSRAYDCFEKWIRLLKGLEQKSNDPIYLDFQMCDGGQKNHLSMEQKNIENLIPNIYDFEANSEIKERNLSKKEFSDFKKLWLTKENKIFWRGTTTGRNYKSIKELNSTNRIRICKSFRNVKNIDFKITKISQNYMSKKKIQDYLISEGIFASEVSESVFSLYRYYPDIPGNSLGWGTVKKYLSGNLIFKTNNEKQLYYYQFLHPWVHYIPVKDDFSDLEEKFNWSQKNIDETIKIAYRGYITIFDYLQNIDNYFINSLLKYRI